MTKEETLWIVIRAFGVYLLVLAIIAFPSAVYSFVVGFSFDGAPCDRNAMPSDNLGSVLSNVSRLEKGNAIKHITQLLVYCGFGAYFVRDGKLLHKVLNREYQSNTDRV